MSLKQPEPILDGESAWCHNGDADDTANTAYDVRQYHLVSSPNDFNTKTMVEFIESDVFSIPGFQRSYVWDLKRASRLIESIIVGLPIPQIFLYEKKTNEFLVIDGQQRLLSLYYFAKGRFPKKNGRAWPTLDRNYDNKIKSMPLNNDDYFTDFKLDLPELILGKPNPLHGRGYDELNDKEKGAFDLRTIRNVIIQQLHPEGYDSMYEIFNRLNSGGVKLAPQEIRHCMYESGFYAMLYGANAKENWRRLIGRAEPDMRMKDVEILLRGFAMLIEGESYRPPMLKFLNQFSNSAKSYDGAKVKTLELLLGSFLDKNRDLPGDAFLISGRFSPTIFEAVFVASCAGRIDQADARTICPERLEMLKNNAEFRNATQSKTTDKANVKTRLSLAHSILVNEDG